MLHTSIAQAAADITATTATSGIGGEVGGAYPPEEGKAEVGRGLLRLLRAQMDMEGSDLEGLERMLLSVHMSSAGPYSAPQV